MTQPKERAQPSSWRALYRVHPCADVFEIISDVELEQLAADIKAQGLNRPVVIWRDPSKPKDDPKSYAVLDGRNRLEALARLGVVFPERPWATNSVFVPGPDRQMQIFTVSSTDDPAALVISANIRRRHLTKEQQAVAIVKTIEAGKIDWTTVVRSFSPTVGKKGGSTKDPVLEKAVVEGAKIGISKSTVKNARAKVAGKAPAPRTTKPAGVSSTPPKGGALPLGAPTGKTTTTPPPTRSARELQQWLERQTETDGPVLDPAIASSSKLDVHFSSESSEHYTPKKILDAVVGLFGEIDLDPCSNEGTPHVPATHHFTKAEDGLTKPWKGRVYMNPPYGGEINRWVEKLIQEHQAGRVSKAIALVPGRSDTAWFARFRNCVFCTVRGRLTFVGNENPAPFPSFVVYIGEDRRGFVAWFEELGDVWQRLDGHKTTGKLPVRASK